MADRAAGRRQEAPVRGHQGGDSVALGVAGQGYLDNNVNNAGALINKEMIKLAVKTK